MLVAAVSPLAVQAEQVRLATMRAPNTALDRLLFEIVSWLMALLSEESRTIAESRQWDIVARYFNSQITRVAANPSPYFENVFNAGDFNVFARRLLGKALNFSILLAHHAWGRLLLSPDLLADNN